MPSCITVICKCYEREKVVKYFFQDISIRYKYKKIYLCVTRVNKNKFIRESL